MQNYQCPEVLFSCHFQNFNFLSSSWILVTHQIYFHAQIHAHYHRFTPSPLQHSHWTRLDHVSPFTLSLAKFILYLFIGLLKGSTPNQYCQKQWQQSDKNHGLYPAKATFTPYMHYDSTLNSHELRGTVVSLVCWELFAKLYAPHRATVPRMVKRPIPLHRELLEL